MLGESTKDLIDAFGYLTEAEGALLQKYAKKLPEGAVCVNVGAGSGTSAVAVLEVRPDLADTFYTVDVRDWDNPFGGLLNERNAFNKYDLPIPNQIREDSKKLGLEWGKEKVDLYIIDGDHSRAGITGDILNWQNNLNQDAVIFIHDYESTKWEAVRDVVNELMFDSPLYEFVIKVDSYVVFRFVGKGQE